ncbi:MAG: hypothetical protein ACKO0Z_04600 [Betaproteobacteria bacterium]
MWKEAYTIAATGVLMGASFTAGVWAHHGYAQGRADHMAQIANTPTMVANPKVLSIRFANNREGSALATELLLEASAQGECLKLERLTDDPTERTPLWLHTCSAVISNSNSKETK